ncbi:MAG: HEAT repeat domain-containing protein [Candidatus Lernaella stagnicola]|nr:HEAT repeat domain-containing protein [Candidatus Lernaella stagnicola]
MAGETLDLRRVINSVATASEPSKQAEILNNALSQISIRQATDYWLDISRRAVDDLSFAKAFLVFLDLPLLEKAFGKKAISQLHFTLRASDKYKELLKVHEQIEQLDAKLVRTLKAKAAMMLQLIFLVRGQAKEEGLPEMRITAPQLVLRILESPTLPERKMRFDLNDYGRAYWNMLIEQLKEADFQTRDEVVYEMLLTESLIDQYQKGTILTSSGAGGAGEARLSDAVMVRMGTNIIKRLNLLLRTTQMYQSADHPSVSAALQAMLGTIEDAMQGRDGLTLSRVGGDILIEDVKIKRKEKFILDFTQALEERNVNSLTLKLGISLEEVRALLMVFAQTDAQIKKAGGVKRILESKGVGHVIVDQFTYGILGEDEEEEAENIASEEKMLVNVVFGKVLDKLAEGSIQQLSPTELGAMIKNLISAALRQDKGVKRTLAQMIMALDPKLAEVAVFSKEGVRDEINWSSARKMIDHLVNILGKGAAETRINTVSDLEKMAELAISRNKETSLMQIVDCLVERLRKGEREIEVITRLFEALAMISRFMVLSKKYPPVIKVLRSVNNMVNYYENLPAEKRDDFARAVSELSATMKTAISTEEVVQALIRELDGDSMSVVDNAMKILETLATESVVEGLLDAFTHPSRSLRNRAFQILTAMGEKSLLVCAMKLKKLGEIEEFARDTNGKLTDDGFFVARNAMDLIAKIGSKRDVDLIRRISDDNDGRLRAESVTVMTRLDENEGRMLSKMRLGDSDKRVREAAVTVIGQLGGPDDVPALIDLFYAEPDLRAQIVKTLGRVGDTHAEQVLIGAASIRYGGNLGKIYRDDNSLRLAALKALSTVGTETARAALRKFVLFNSNPLLRIMFVPWRYRSENKQMLQHARDSIQKIERQITKKAEDEAA